MAVKFDPSRAVDTSIPPPEKRPGRFGWFGPFPSRACDHCGGEFFNTWDWNMGYRCVECHQPFGTEAEWKY